MSAGEVAGDDGDIRAGDEHADAGVEAVHVAGAGAGAFGEEDVGAGFGGEAIAKIIHGVTAKGVFSPHVGQGIHAAGGEDGEERGFKERVRRRRWGSVCWERAGGAGGRGRGGRASKWGGVVGG